MIIKQHEFSTISEARQHPFCTRPAFFRACVNPQNNEIDGYLEYFGQIRLYLE